MKIPFLRKVDRLAGIAIIKVQGLRRRKSSIPKNPKKILIIKLFGFGNFIFLSPVFRSLKKMFPKAELHVLTFRQNKEICELYSDYVDQIHTINFSTFKMGFSIAKFCAKNKGKFDIAIDFEQFVRLAAIIGNFARPKYFLGIATPNSGKNAAFDHTLPYQEKKHVVEEYYDAVKFLAKECGKRIDETPVLAVPRYSKTKKAEILLKKAKGRILIGVCPGGRVDDPERKYPKERFAEALEKVSKEISRRKLNAVIAFFGTNSEKPDISYVLSKITELDNCVDFSGTSLNDSAYLISKCKMLISNDTGPIHLAAALGIHCVGLYGPSKEWIYGPYTQKRSILRDKKHKPVRSNHNEKNVGWKAAWWSKPEELYTEIIHILRK